MLKRKVLQSIAWLMCLVMAFIMQTGADNILLAARMGPDAYMIGDINGDGFITGADVTLLAQYLRTGKGISDLRTADLNMDGIIDFSDFMIFGRWFAGVTPSLGHQAGNLTFMAYDYLNNVVYNAAFEVVVNDNVENFVINTGVLSIGDITPGSTVTITAIDRPGIPYEFLRWDVFSGVSDISPLSNSQTFTMPENSVILFPMYEPVIESYFGWDIPLEWVEGYTDDIE